MSSSLRPLNTPNVVLDQDSAISQAVMPAELYANRTVEDQKVRDIMEMGFTKEQAQQALDVCGMDKQAAIEHILTSV